MNWEAVKPLVTLIFTTALKLVGAVVKPLVTLIFTTALKLVGAALVTHGILSSGPGLEAFTGAAMAAGGAVWSWWVQRGHLQAAAFLKQLTQTATQAAAIQVAKHMKPEAISDAVVDAKTRVAVSAPLVTSVPK